MKITEQRGPDDITLVILEGRLVEESQRDFQEYFDDVSRRSRRMVFDFAKVSSMAGDGMWALFQLFSSITEVGGRMSIGNVSKNILDKFIVTRIADVLGADTSMKGALARIRRKPPKIRVPKMPHYTELGHGAMRTLQHGKCGTSFFWFGDPPAFCPNCGRSTKSKQA